MSKTIITDDIGNLPTHPDETIINAYLEQNHKTGHISTDILRDLYLAGFYRPWPEKKADGTLDIQGPLPLQGPIYNGKNWTPQYEKTFLKKELYNLPFNVNASYYENYINACQYNKNMDDPILYINGSTYTNRQLIDMATNLAASLQQLIDTEQRQPKISVFVNNSVEEPTITIATSILGGIVQFVDITKSPDDMKKNLDDFNPDILLMDEVLSPLIPFLNDKSLPIIVGNTTKEYNQPNMISFQQALECGKNYRKISEVIPKKLDPMQPFLVITSSGTTGRPKPIVHSIYSVNQSILKILFTDYPQDRKNVMMKIIPAHIGLGIITTLSTSLISGTKLAFIAGNGPADSVRGATDFIKNFKEFRKINGLDNDSKLIMFAAPMFIKDLENEVDKGNITDLSYIECILVAGAKISEEDLIRYKEKFKKLGFSLPINNGYGNNENGGAVLLNSNSHNRNGSGGFPVIGTDVVVVDENKKPLGPNQEGELYVLSGSQFLYYLGNEEATAETKVNLFGTGPYVKMNDIVHQDEDGFGFIKGRTTRVIERFDCKISIDHIEEKIKNHPSVKDCACVTIKDEHQQDVLYAYITINGEIQEKLLIEQIDERLSALEKTNAILVLEQMPHMNNGKIDYQNLIAIAREHQKEKKGHIKREKTKPISNNNQI